MSAFFVVLLGSSSATSPLVDVTGVSATGAVGAVAAGTAQQVFLTGVDATGFAGAVAVTADANTAVSGLSASAFIGQAQALAESDIVLTGVSATASPGTLTATGTGFVSLTGVSGQTQLGNESILIGGNITLIVTGLAANGSVGTVNVALLNNVTVLLTGVASTASAGSVVVAGSSLTNVTGVNGTATVRPVTVQASVLTNTIGVSGTGAVGSVVAQTVQTANATGVAATGQVSAVTTSVTAFVSVNVTGVSATANVGAVTARTSDDFIVLSTTTSPYLHAYEWDNTSGFGAKFADPATLPIGGVNGIDIKPKQTGETVRYVAAAINAAGDPRVWQLDGISGWGTATTMSGGGNISRDVAWLSYGSPATEWLVAGNALSGASRLRIKQFVSGAFTGSTQSDANTTSNVLSVSAVQLSSSVRGLISGKATTSYVTCTDFTTALTGYSSAPSVQPSGVVNGVTTAVINLASNPRAVLFAAHDASPYVSAWPLELNGSSQSQFGTKYSNPASLPAGNGNGVAFRQTSGNAGQIAVAHDTSPRISVYAWSAGFGTKYSNPATLPTGNAESVRFNALGNCIAVGHATSPYVSVYPWDTSTGFGTKLSNPSTSMTATVQSIRFS